MQSESVSGNQPATSLAVAPYGRWEITLDGRIGLPNGYLRVGETPQRGTRLLLNRDLGIDVSEALEAGVAFHLTDRDALRVRYLYEFLDGDARFGQTLSYNGDGFGPGRVHTNADFSRVSLDYERVLMNAYNIFLTGTVGLTYVYSNPTLSQHGHSNSEDFYLQELPVPIAGARVDVPLDPKAWVRLEVSGGGLPRVASGRTEGGTVYLRQINADAGLSLAYNVTRALQIDVGYHYSYFLQHETSHEDDNAFLLRESGFRARVMFRF